MPKKRRVAIGFEIHYRELYCRLKGGTGFVYRSNLEGQSSNLSGDERY